MQTVTDNTQPSVLPEAEKQWAANRALTMEKAKERLRQRVSEGYYPLEQITGPPCVTMDEPI